jgi:GNAT superfamily N-acetyltransferase
MGLKITAVRRYWMRSRGLVSTRACLGVMHCGSRRSPWPAPPVRARGAGHVWRAGAPAGGRPRAAADHAASRELLARHGHLRVARLGELARPLDHPALVAVDAGGQLLGMLTYVPGQDRRQWEILTLHAGQQWHGAGTALVEAVGQLARRQGCTRLWVITTNDNVDALRFYQRRGFCLVMVHRGAVDRSRAALKPEIPATGAYGIPLRDEIELEKQP